MSATRQTSMRLCESDRETLAAAGDGDMTTGLRRACIMIRTAWCLIQYGDTLPSSRWLLRQILRAAGVPYTPPVSSEVVDDDPV